MQTIRFVLILLALVVPFGRAEEGAFTPELAKKLLPAAAGMSIADFEKLTQSPAPKAADFKSQPLTLVLLNLRPNAAANVPAAEKEFGYADGIPPRPDKLAAALQGSKADGYVSFIQPACITECTCKGVEGRVLGEVAFKLECCSGRVSFVARKVKDQWAITEFLLPAHGLKTVRGEDGGWKQEPLLDK